MRRTPIPKRIRIMAEPFAQRIERGCVGAHALAQLGVAVDALRAGHDLLPAHEEVVGVGEGGVGRVWVGVEGAGGAREFVDAVEVGGVLGVHEAAEVLFLGGAGGRKGLVGI